MLTFDYRGFGDSSKISLDEDTVVEDTGLALAWLRTKVGLETRILVFGHSMGTAIASHALANMAATQGADLPPISGVILMAAFNNFTDEFIALKTKGWIPKPVVSFLLEQLNMQFRLCNGQFQLPQLLWKICACIN